MTPVKVRGLGSIGIIADPSPYDIEDTNALSGGVNIRFSRGRITRGPVARTVSILDFEPEFLTTLPPAANGIEELVIVGENFSTIKRLNGPNNFEDLTPDDWLPVGGNDRYSATILGGVSYLNRFTHVPIYKAPSDSKYQPIPGWNPDWRCTRLVAYKDFLVALGCRIDGQQIPTLIKWSDRTGFGAPPSNWSVDDPSSLGGQNIVNEMQHAIIDAATLRDSLIIYCTDSVWTMDFIGGQFLFSWRKLFDSMGIINENCAIQIGDNHFVFDRNDIYMHNGASFQSIAGSKVKNFIFDALDYNKKHLCFVTHEPVLNEVRFHYPSEDRFVGFERPENGCNRIAAFNYNSNTWTFYDIPNVTSSSISMLVSGRIWDDEEGELAWRDSEGSWSSVSGDEARHTFYVAKTSTAQGLSAPRLYGHDLVNDGRLPFPPEPEALRPSVAERIGIDLDNAGKPLSDYIRIMEIRPQMSIEEPDACQWFFGGNGIVDEEPFFTGPFAFDPRQDKKIDVNTGGQYLAYRMVIGGDRSFGISGFDAILVPGGRR